MKFNGWLIAISSVLMTAFTLQKDPGKSGGYVVDGRMEGLPDNSKLYLVGPDGDTVNQAMIREGKFRFEGNISGGSEGYFIYVPKEISEDVKSNILWLENTSVKVMGDVQELKELTVEGSKAHEDYLAADALLKQSKEIDLPAIKGFIKTRSTSMFIPYMLYKVQGFYPVEEAREMFDNLAAAVKQSRYGDLALHDIKAREEFPDFFEKGPKNTIMPDFIVTSATGDEVSVKSVLKRSKLTLIDVWASWCGPCRASIPEIREVYDRLNAKGFNIIGLSVDKSISNWLKAVKEDNTPWEHFSDKYMHGSKQVFGVSNLPAYFLVDSEGRVLYFQNLIPQRTEDAKPSDGIFVGNKDGRLMRIVDSLLSIH